jgi:hypothetical protein
VALLSASLLLSLIPELPSSDHSTPKSAAVPLDIGITEGGQPEHQGLVRISVNAVARKRWNDTTHEIAGSFRAVPLQTAVARLKFEEHPRTLTSCFAIS